MWRQFSNAARIGPAILGQTTTGPEPAEPKPLFPPTQTPAPAGMFQGTQNVPRYAPLKAVNDLARHPQLQSNQPMTPAASFTTPNWAGPLARAFHGDRPSGNETASTAAAMRSTQNVQAGLFNSIYRDKGYDQSKYNQVEHQQFVRRNPTGVNVNVGGDESAHYIPAEQDKLRRVVAAITGTRRPERVVNMGSQTHGGPGDTLFGVANHEFEHARQDVPGNTTFDTAGGFPVTGGRLLSLPYEVPAGIGDMVFAGRAARQSIPAVPIHGTNKGATPAMDYYRQDGRHPGPLQSGEYLDVINNGDSPWNDMNQVGKPQAVVHDNVEGNLDLGYKPTSSGKFQHTIQFPSGYKQDINHMVDRAEEHGYFDGRSMTELLATPVGQQYLRQIASPPESLSAAAAMRSKQMKSVGAFHWPSGASYGGPH